MNTFTLLGAIGSVASVVALFLPGTGWKVRVMHAAYVLFIIITSGTAIYYWDRVKQAGDIKTQLQEIIDGRRMNYSDTGYIFAALTFLRAHKDEYPEPYSRAIELCDTRKCTGTGFQHDLDMIPTASYLDGILRGILAMNRSG
jgi:hypothetical protein